VSGSLLFAGTQVLEMANLNIDTKRIQDFATVTTDPFAQGQGDLTVNTQIM